MAEGKVHVSASDKKHRVCAADCAIFRDGKVLMQKRSFGMWKGYWCLIGSKVDRGETIIHAAFREVKEESGLDVKRIHMLGIYDGKDRDPEQHCIAVGFLCETDDAEPSVSSEATEMKFFHPDRLPERVAFDHRLIIEDALKMRQRIRESSGTEPEKV